MNIKLLSDRVLIEADEAETKTESGLIVSKSKGPDEFQTGKVVAIGPGKQVEETADELFFSMFVKEGDKVVFQYSKTFHHEGKNYQLVSQNDIVAIIN